MRLQTVQLAVEKRRRHIGFYNLFDERESGQDDPRRSSNQIRFLSYISNEFMFRKEISM